MRLVAEFMSIDRQRSISDKVPTTVPSCEIQAEPDADPAVQARSSTALSFSPPTIPPLGSVIDDESASHYPVSDTDEQALNYKTSVVDRS